MGKKKARNPSGRAGKATSLHPLSVEDALKGLLGTKPPKKKSKKR